MGTFGRRGDPEQRRYVEASVLTVEQRLHQLRLALAAPEILVPRPKASESILSGLFARCTRLKLIRLNTRSWFEEFPGGAGPTHGEETKKAGRSRVDWVP